MKYQDLTLMATEMGTARDASGTLLTTFKLLIPRVMADALVCSFDRKALKELQKAGTAADAKWEGALALGRALADILLPDAVRRVVTERMTQAKAQGQGLRLRLALPNELQRLPWEFMAINRAGGESTAHDFLALEPNLSIVRDPANALPVWQIQAEPTDTINVLAAFSSPEDQPPLDVDGEQAKLTEAFKSLTRARLKPINHATLDAVLAGNDKAHVFHFAGHGVFVPVPMSAQPGKTEGQGALVFENDSNTSAFVDPSVFGVALRAKGVRVALLGACHSAERDDLRQWGGVAESLLKADVGAVVGMQFAVRDDSAIAFAGQFYGALLAGMTIDEAVTAGRVMLAGKGDVRGFGTPVLYLRDADGVVLPEMLKVPTATAEQASIATAIQTQYQTIGGVHIGSIDARGSQGMIVGGAGPVNVTQQFGNTVNTGGGAYIGGNVTAGGDVVTGDKIVNINTTPVEVDAEISGATPEQTKRMKSLYDVLGGFYFSEDDLQDLCFRMDADWDNLSGGTKKGKARAFVQFCFKSGKLDELYGLVRQARPRLNL